MSSTILQWFKNIVQAYFSDVALAVHSVSFPITKIKARHSVCIQKIQTGGKNMEPVHNVWLLEKLVQA